MISIVWLSRDGEVPSWWDQAILEDLLNGELWGASGLQTFKHVTGLTSSVPVGTTGAVLVVPGRFYADDAGVMNVQVAMHGLEWCLLVVTTDEEALFPWAELDHPNWILWRQTPWPVETDDCLPYPGGPSVIHYLPEGYQPGTAQILHTFPQLPPRQLDWFFAGQVTHQRRQEMAKSLRQLGGGVLIETDGFAQGWSQTEYLASLDDAKVAPCPSGPATVDSFRLCEALEAGCVPIVDSRTPRLPADRFWDELHPGSPIRRVSHWDQAESHVREVTGPRYHREAARVGAWWALRKRQLVQDFRDDVARLSSTRGPEATVTALVATSPTLLSPARQLAMTTSTIYSAWHHWPDAEVVVMCDGVRPEQEHHRAAYDEYVHMLVDWARVQPHDVLVVAHDEWLHQAEMTRRALPLVETPQLLFLEHDTPLITDQTKLWTTYVQDCLSEGIADVVRFHFESVIPEPHRHLMLRHSGDEMHGIRTVQWSQRPHLASVAYYRRILSEHFAPEDRVMIEDVMHGVVRNSYELDGEYGWLQHRLWIWTQPELGGPTMKWSLHVDGRGGEQKYAMIKDGKEIW